MHSETVKLAYLNFKTIFCMSDNYWINWAGVAEWVSDCRMCRGPHFLSSCRLFISWLTSRKNLPLCLRTMGEQRKTRVE